MKRSELIKILRSAKRFKDPEVTFWIDDDVVLELKECGEFDIIPEITMSFRIARRLFSDEKPKTIKRKLIKNKRNK